MSDAGVPVVRDDAEDSKPMVRMTFHLDLRPRVARGDEVPHGVGLRVTVQE